MTFPSNKGANMFAKYAWIVEYDHLDNHDIEVFGPSDIDPQHEQDLKEGNGKKFRMYDDDNELYYSGRIVGDFDGFEPLDDYGMPNAGAVHIEYQDDDGRWEGYL